LGIAAWTAVCFRTVRAITRGGAEAAQDIPPSVIRAPFAAPAQEATIRCRVKGLLNGDAHTARFQTPGGRRPRAEFTPFPPVSCAPDSGIPVALSRAEQR
jgi:hypothetical protein